MTRANAKPELPGHLPGAGKTRSKVNRSRSAAGAGLGAQRRGRVARIEVGTSGSLVRPPACRAPPTPELPPARAAASCHRCRRPHLWQRGRGERLGAAGGVGNPPLRSPPLHALLSARTASCPVRFGQHEAVRDAPRPGGRGDPDGAGRGAHQLGRLGNACY